MKQTVSICLRASSCLSLKGGRGKSLQASQIRLGLSRDNSLENRVLGSVSKHSRYRCRPSLSVWALCALMVAVNATVQTMSYGDGRKTLRAIYNMTCNPNIGFGFGEAVSKWDECEIFDREWKTARNAEARFSPGNGKYRKSSRHSWIESTTSTVVRLFQKNLILIFHESDENQNKTWLVMPYTDISSNKLSLMWYNEHSKPFVYVADVYSSYPWAFPNGELSDLVGGAPISPPRRQTPANAVRCWIHINCSYGNYVFNEHNMKLTKSTGGKDLNNKELASIRYDHEPKCKCGMEKEKRAVFYHTMEIYVQGRKEYTVTVQED